MLISKFSLWTCALALCGGLTLHAQDNPAQAAARAALNQKMLELDANPSATTTAPTPTVDKGDNVVMTPINHKPAKAKKDAAKQTAKQKKAEVTAAKAGTNDAGIKPITAPAQPIPLSKEDKLNQLLARYKADQITPEEYHAQRAAIIAEP